MGISDSPPFLQTEEQALKLSFQEQCQYLCHETDQIKKPLTLPMKHQHSSLHGGHFRVRNMTLRPVAGNTVRKWKRENELRIF